MHEHVARAMYYVSIHLLYASIVGCAAWALTRLQFGSATVKYWIWVATGLNFLVPAAALMDKVWAPHLGWAAPLGVIGDAVWEMTKGRTGVTLATVWTIGALAMLTRLVLRLAIERREVQRGMEARERGFLADGVPVAFGKRQSTPAVDGVLRPQVSLPAGIDRLLSRGELRAVLLHELAHARRRDNLIRLFYEIGLCVLWFHPLVWIAGSRMALYRELSCDESVMRSAHGRELVAALAKLAAPERSLLLQATASSHIGPRLARLARPQEPAQYVSSLVLTLLFGTLLATGVLGTVAHTACCFVLKR
jgi:beta-lactamase regulating signal transducer with metallopeptidase domain